MDGKQEVQAQTNNTVSTQRGYLLTVNVPSHPFGKSTIGIFITTEDGYRDHVYIPTTGNPSWTFKIPPNQGNSVQVCVNSGPQSEANCHFYNTNGSYMSVSLPAISDSSSNNSGGSGSSSHSNEKSNNNNDSSKSHHDSDTSNNNNKSHIADTSHTNFKDDNSKSTRNHHTNPDNTADNGNGTGGSNGNQGNTSHGTGSAGSDTHQGNSHHGFGSDNSGSDNRGFNSSNSSSSTGSNPNNNNNHDAPTIQFIGPNP